MAFVIAMMVTWGGAVGLEGAELRVSSPVYAPAQNSVAEPHRHQQADPGGCAALVERLCRVTRVDVCRTIEREHQRRQISPAEEAQCRRLLTDEDALERLVRRFRKQR